MSDIPYWLKRALLGTCYWIGHRRALYRDYPLGESAMVAELCNLLFANLPTNLKLICEVQYSQIIDISEGDSAFTEKSRVDLCICGPIENKKANPLEHLLYVLEVKRGKASKAAINADLRRLLELKRARPEIRAFLLLISEGQRPTDFVTEESFAIRKNLPIANTSGFCRTRVVMKAVQAVKSLNTAHYGCAIEIL